MSSRFIVLCSAAGGFLLGITGQIRAELLTSSPFLPPQGQTVVAPTAANPLELRGITTVNGNTMFSIFDPVKKSGTWVKLNELGHDFSIKKYEQESDTVTVDYQGRSLALAMRTPKIASSGTAVAPLPATIPSPIANFRPNSPTPNVAVNSTPPTEAARLADWSAEIQRRRDMRAQAAGQPPTPAADTQSAPQVQTTPMRPQAQPNPVQNGAGGNQRQRGPQRQRNGQ